MRLTFAKVEASNPLEPARSEELELIVDTGSLLTWLPKPTLRSLNIRPLLRKGLKTIERRRVVRYVGFAVVKFKRHRALAEIVFADHKDVPVLGTMALESLGYRVNPRTKRLEFIGVLAV